MTGPGAPQRYKITRCPSGEWEATNIGTGSVVLRLPTREELMSQLQVYIQLRSTVEQAVIEVAARQARKGIGQ